VKKLYTTTVVIKGGRDGNARSDDAQLDVALAFPKVLGGSGDGTNPEQLFAAGFGACFTSSLGVAAKSLGLSPQSIAVSATVTLTVNEAGAYVIDALLEPVVKGLGQSDTLRLVDEARRICAYSNALKGTATLDVQLR
jgi:osmotically inducible protein OsmC